MVSAAPSHHRVTANGVGIHYARLAPPSSDGGAPTLILLHGWPEFWLTWLPLMEILAGRGFDLIAPDLRGFGDSEKPNAGPSDQAGADVHAADIAALMTALELPRVGIVAHDIGAYVVQPLARALPERLTGLFLFDCPYAGIGSRWAAPEQLREIWYQSLHQQPFAAQLIGSSRQACELYFGYFLRHWAAGNPHAFDDVVGAFVDNFLRPGNLQGGFNWYISQNAARLAAIRGEAAEQPRITVPTCVRWGDRDPVLRYEWSDRLGEVFADLDLAPFAGAGHFPHREAPEKAAEEIERFFRGVG